MRHKFRGETNPQNRQIADLIYFRSLSIADRLHPGIANPHVLPEIPSSAEGSCFPCTKYNVSMRSDLVLFRVHTTMAHTLVPWACVSLKDDVSTYRLIVSESPQIHRCRFGRVIATTHALVTVISYLQVHLPFKRRFSARNPTSCAALLRTKLTTTASFSRPWNPSTLPSSMPGYFSRSIRERSANCPL